MSKYGTVSRKLATCKMTASDLSVGVVGWLVGQLNETPILNFIIHLVISSYFFGRLCPYQK
jgi:hypothetical protein